MATSAHEFLLVQGRGMVSGTFPVETERGGPEQAEVHGHIYLTRYLVRLETAEADEIGQALLALRSFLMGHFAREEGPGGLFELALEARYRFEHTVGELRSQHLTMIEALDRALVLAQLPYDGMRPSLEWQLVQLTEQLTRHEAVENELLQEALCGDIGGGD